LWTYAANFAKFQVSIRRFVKNCGFPGPVPMEAIMFGKHRLMCITRDI
jgi:hypothetical protein